MIKGKQVFSSPFRLYLNIFLYIFKMLQMLYSKPPPKYIFMRKKRADTKKGNARYRTLPFYLMQSITKKNYLLQEESSLLEL